MKTPADSIRAFFAIPLPAEIKESVGQIIHTLQHAYPEQAIHWTQLDNLHVTLHFLSALKRDDVESLVSHVRDAIHEFPEFHLTLDTLELFPTYHQPHVISLKTKPDDIQRQLVERIGKGILICDYKVDERPFRGHLTLARLNQAKTRFHLDDIPFTPIASFLVDHICLYQSELHSNGTVYQVLDQMTLQKS